MWIYKHTKTLTTNEFSMDFPLFPSFFLFLFSSGFEESNNIDLWQGTQHAAIIALLMLWQKMLAFCSTLSTFPPIQKGSKVPPNNVMLSRSHGHEMGGHGKR